jgi:oxygen-dependent protoporphyrinogen oxidase
MRVAVVGGGIAGLAAAWELRDRAEVTVFEPGHLGGRLQTGTFMDQPTDLGADAFLTRVPEAVDLCTELGLTGELIAPAPGRTLLWWGGRLRPLPDGLVLGVPRRLGPLLRSGLLSPLGMVRAGLDLGLPRTDPGDDTAVWDLVARRFGRQVASRLVDPLVGSIHAGRTEELSVAATAPQLLAAARRSRSLLLGLRASGAVATGGPPMFQTPQGGVGRLVERLTEALDGHGVRTVHEHVTAVRSTTSGVEIAPLGERYDAAVIAVAAPVAARLLGDAAPAGLAGVTATSVTLVTMAFAVAELPTPGGVNGVLVSREEGRLMTACSFASHKWPQRPTPGRMVVRVSTGWSGDDRSDRIDDAALVDRLSAELGAALGAAPGITPLDWQVNRWPASFPRYLPGHLGRVAAAEAELAVSAPAVTLAGSSYRGAGIPACIGSGRRAARTLLERLGIDPVAATA